MSGDGRAVCWEGRDFFVPKPKTLTALNEFVVDNVGSVEECAVLSNCARLELMLVVNHKSKECMTTKMIEDAVSQRILAQVECHSSSQQSILQPIFNFDRTQAIDRNAAIDRKITDELLEWTHLEGVEDVCRHLCLISAGMAERPNRPGRPVSFRPFSSRDAHILLQLKRTAKVYESLLHLDRLQSTSPSHCVVHFPSR